MGAAGGGGPGLPGLGGAAPTAERPPGLSQVRELRGREGVRGGRLLFFSFLYSKKVLFETGGGKREKETSDGGLVTSLGLPVSSQIGRAHV